MSTFMAKAETVERKWYVIDAEGKTLGKVAVMAADILRGKHRPEFTPHVDCGEYVIVINAAKVRLTGNKLTQKTYKYHTGYIGGLKTTIRLFLQPSPKWQSALQLRECFLTTQSAQRALQDLKFMQAQNTTRQHSSLQL